jgi:predicted transcriptional regulator of viral defense system
MVFDRLIELVGDEPVFEISLLFAGQVNPDSVRLQLSRWVNAGRIYQLRRGLYALAPPYQKVKPHPFLIANRLQRASYVSGQSALAFYGLIPEVSQATFSVTAGRPERLITPLGIFEYRHIKPEYLHGYQMIALGNDQQALVATAEKALLDMVYLQPEGASTPYLQELRLQNLERLDLGAIREQAENYAIPKLQRAVTMLTHLAQTEAEEYETL